MVVLDQGCVGTTTRCGCHVSFLVVHRGVHHGIEFGDPLYCFCIFWNYGFSSWCHSHFEVSLCHWHWALDKLVSVLRDSGHRVFHSWLLFQIIVLLLLWIVDNLQCWAVLVPRRGALWGKSRILMCDCFVNLCVAVIVDWVARAGCRALGVDTGNKMSQKVRLWWSL